MFGWECGGIDPLRVACTLATLMDVSTYILAYLNANMLTFGITVAAAGSVVLFAVRKQLWAWASTVTKDTWNTLRTDWYYWKLIMSKREDEVYSMGMEAQYAWIEDAVTMKKMTRYQADQHYAKLCRHWPELAHCIQGPAMQPKDRMKESQANRERNPDGTVKPVKLPGSTFVPIKGGVTTKKARTLTVR